MEIKASFKTHEQFVNSHIAVTKAVRSVNTNYGGCTIEGIGRHCREYQKFEITDEQVYGIMFGQNINIEEGKVD